MNNLFNHIKLVSTHRKYVRQLCFKMGIPIQGILHDLSKYSPSEIILYKYYTGSGSPHNNLRKEVGYSYPWLHHKYHNKHHYQFWVDEDENDNIVAIDMPYKYVIEMFCDRVGASKAYLKQDFTTKSPYEYYLTHSKNSVMHPSTKFLLEKLLKELADKNSLEEFVEWYSGASAYMKFLYEKNLEVHRGELHDA